MLKAGRPEVAMSPKFTFGMPKPPEEIAALVMLLPSSDLCVCGLYLNQPKRKSAISVGLNVFVTPDAKLKVVDDGTSIQADRSGSGTANDSKDAFAREAEVVQTESSEHVYRLRQHVVNTGIERIPGEGTGPRAHEILRYCRIRAVRGEVRRFREFAEDGQCLGRQLAHRDQEGRWTSRRRWIQNLRRAAEGERPEPSKAVVLLLGS